MMMTAVTVLTRNPFNQLRGRNESMSILITPELSVLGDYSRVMD